MLRILVLNDDFPPKSHGGAGIIALNLAREMQKRGHEVLVVTSVREKKDAGEVMYEGLRIHRIRTSYPLRFQAYVSLWNIPVVRQLKTVISDFKPDVVHAHNIHSFLSYRSLRAAKRSGARVILTCHDTMAISYGKMIDPYAPTSHGWRELGFGYNPIRNSFIRRTIASNVDRVVAVSDAVKAALEANGILQSTVIHNGIDVADWEVPDGSIAAFKKSLRLGNSVVLFSGRLTVVKGAMKILEAIALVRKMFPDVQLLVIGREDTYADNMMKYSDKLGIAGRLIFTGWITDAALHEAYHAASLVVVPSLYLDPFPTVNLEAFACKKPIVATCFGGSREIVEDSESGYIVDPNDVSALAGKIDELLGDKEKAMRFGEKGYARVTNEFSLESQVDEFEKLFQHS